MPPNLVFEIDLLVAVIGAEHDQVARRVKGVQACQLLGKYVGRVEPLEERSRVVDQRQMERVPAVYGREHPVPSILQHHEADSIKARHARDQTRISRLDGAGIEPAGQIGEVNVRQAARVRDLDAAPCLPVSREHLASMLRDDVVGQPLR